MVLQLPRVLVTTATMLVAFVPIMFTVLSLEAQYVGCKRNTLEDYIIVDLLIHVPMYLWVDVCM